MDDIGNKNLPFLLNQMMFYFILIQYGLVWSHAYIEQT